MRFKCRMTNLSICEILVRCFGVSCRRLLSAPGFPDGFYATRELLFNYMECNIAKELEERKRESVSRHGANRIDTRVTVGQYAR